MHPIYPNNQKFEKIYIQKKLKKIKKNKKLKKKKENLEGKDLLI